MNDLALKQHYLERARADWQRWQEERRTEQTIEDARQEDKDRSAAQRLATSIFGENVVLRTLPDPDNMVFNIPGENVVLLYEPERWNGHARVGNCFYLLLEHCADCGLPLVASAGCSISIRKWEDFAHAVTQGEPNPRGHEEDCPQHPGARAVSTPIQPALADRFFGLLEELLDGHVEAYHREPQQ